MIFGPLLIFFKFNFYNLSGIPSECQTIWIQIRPNKILGLIWAQSVCKGYHQQTPLADKQFDVHAHLFNGAGDLNFCLHLYLLPLNLKSSAANIC